MLRKTVIAVLASAALAPTLSLAGEPRPTRAPQPIPHPTPRRPTTTSPGTSDSSANTYSVDSPKPTAIPRSRAASITPTRAASMPAHGHPTSAGCATARRFPHTRSGGSLEWDFYGGWKPTFGDFTLDLGTLYYWYPGDASPAAAGRSRQSESEYVGDLCRRAAGSGSPPSTRTASTTRRSPCSIARHVVLRSDGHHPARRFRQGAHRAERHRALGQAEIQRHRSAHGRTRQ